MSACLLLPSKTWIPLFAIMAAFSQPLVAQGPPSGSKQLAFSKDGKTVAVGGLKINLFEVETGNKIREINEPGFQLAFSAFDNNLLAATGPGNTLRLWDIAKSQWIREFPPFHGPEAFPLEYVDFHFALDPKGRYVGVCFGRRDPNNLIERVEGHFRLLEISSGKTVQSIDLKKGSIQGVAFSGDGNQIAFYQNDHSRNPTVEIYQIDPWKSLASVSLSPGTLKEKGPGFPTFFNQPFGCDMAGVPNSRQFLVAGGVCEDAGRGEIAGTRSWHEHGLIWLVDGKDKPQSTLLAIQKQSIYRNLSLSPDGNRYVVGATLPNPMVRLQLEMRDLTKNHTLWSTPGGDYYGSSEIISPKGNLVGTLFQKDLLLFHANNGKLERSIKVEK